MLGTCFIAKLLQIEIVEELIMLAMVGNFPNLLPISCTKKGVEVFFLVRMFDKTVYFFVHERNENFTILIPKNLLNNGKRHTRPSKRIHKSKNRWWLLSFIVV